MYTNADITVYNKTAVNRETVYVRAIVKGVFWSNSEGALRVKTGLETSDKTRIFIPLSAEFSKPFAEVKAFLKAPQSFMTFNSGDLVVKGIVDDKIKTQKELESRYDNVREITSVDVKNYGSETMRHMELICK